MSDWNPVGDLQEYPPSGSAAGNIDLKGFNILDSTGPITLGADATPGNASSGDTHITSDLEVDGVLYADDNIVILATKAIKFGTTRTIITSPADGQLLLTEADGAGFGRLYFGGTGAGNCYILQNATDFTFRSSTTDAPTGCSMGQVSVGSTSIRGVQGNAAGCGVTMGSGGAFAFSDNTSGSGGSVDTSIQRSAAGIAMAGTGAIGTIAFFRAKRNHQTSGSNITLTAAQSGDVVTSTGTLTVTLPAPTAGVWYSLATASAHAMTVTPTSGSLYVNGTGAASYASTAAIGNTMTTWSDGTSWFAQVSGTWA